MNWIDGRYRFISLVRSENRPEVWIDGRYRIIRQLHRDNWSEVWLGTDCQDEKQKVVVIKSFRCNETARENFRTKMFFKEVEDLRIFNHQNISKVFGAGVDPQNKIYYIVTEYCGLQTLESVIAANRISYHQKLSVITQIIDALVYAHSKNVIHRNLKPSNILINDLNKVKLIDFGLNKLKNILYDGFSGENHVSRKYDSWEQMVFKGIDHRTDQYSLGIIIYELLTGSFLQHGSDIQRSIMEHPGLNWDWKMILLKMTMSRPEDRYGSMAEVRSSLRNIIEAVVPVPCYGIGFTNSTITNLYHLGYIQNESSRFEAAEVIRRDLSQSQTFMDLDLSKPQDQPRYKLYGKQLEYHCVVDKYSGKTLTIIRVNERNPLQHEVNKERAVPIDGKWDVMTVPQKNPKFNDINDLLKYVEEQKQQKMIQQEEEVSRKHIIERWQKVLELYFKSLMEQKKELEYDSFEVEESGEIIRVKLRQPVDSSIYSEDQLLVMTDGNNQHRIKPAGYCVGVKGDILEIQLAKGANPKDFADKGKISIDQSAVLSAISRQRRALKAVLHNELPNTDLAEILFQPERASSSPSAKPVQYGSELDPSKREAVKKALGAKDLFLLQGPPGTGKTTFISELVYQIVKENPDSKILISSQSNVAVDHALNKIQSLLPNAQIIRIGHKDKLSLGSERWTIEEQIDSWLERIKSSCINYSDEDRRRIESSFNDLQKYQKILDEIAGLELNLDRIRAMKIDIENKLRRLQGWGSTILRIRRQIFRDDNHGSQMDERERFENQNELKKQADQLKAKEIQLKNKLEQLKRTIRAHHSADLHSLRQHLDQQQNHILKQYEISRKIEQIQQEWFSRLETDDKLKEIIVRRANIVGATCLGIAGLPSAYQVVFDWVIVDEAGRATPPELLVPLTMGKKVVLVGDHKQLPPLVDQEILELDLKDHDILVKELETSLFEKLMTRISAECKDTLKEQYRMHPAIGNLISQVFYGGKLRSKPSPEERFHGISRWKNRGVVWISTAGHPERFEQVVQAGASHYTFLNRLEARLIFETLIMMEQEYAVHQVRKEVGIITGYQAQKAELRKLFETDYKGCFQWLNIEINTVDAFQGRETDLIFYSVVRSNKQGKIGFLSDARRLNVALSRARELLVIVGDHLSVTKEEFVNRGRTNPFAKVLDYIESNPDFCALERILKHD